MTHIPGDSFKGIDMKELMEIMDNDMECYSLARFMASQKDR
ncbi:MAG: hypothetical protein QM498_00665 [Desulfobacterium sp.]